MIGVGSYTLRGSYGVSSRVIGGTPQIRTAKLYTAGALAKIMYQNIARRLIRVLIGSRWHTGGLIWRCARCPHVTPYLISCLLPPPSQRCPSSYFSSSIIHNRIKSSCSSHPFAYIAFKPTSKTKLQQLSQNDWRQIRRQGQRQQEHPIVSPTFYRLPSVWCLWQFEFIESISNSHCQSDNLII